jgi:hypothetical protein
MDWCVAPLDGDLPKAVNYGAARVWKSLAAS